MFFQTAYGPRERIQVSFVDAKDMAKQEFREESDINNIVAKFERTGVLDFVATNEPRYGDCVGFDYEAMMNQVALANEMFAQLPAKLRKRFQNDPQEFLDFIDDPENDAEAIRMGLKTAPEPSSPTDGAQPLGGSTPPLNPSPTPSPAPSPGASDGSHEH